VEIFGEDKKTHMPPKKENRCHATRGKNHETPAKRKPTSKGNGSEEPKLAKTGPADLRNTNAQTYTEPAEKKAEIESGLTWP